MISTLLVALAAVAAWFFFTNLFIQRSSDAVPPRTSAPAPISAANDTELLFVPEYARSLPVIQLPVVDTETDSDSSTAATDSAAGNQPEHAESTPVTVDTAATTAPSVELPPPGDTPRGATPKSTVRAPLVTPAVAATEPGLLPLAIQPEPPATPRNIAGPTPVSGNTIQQVDSGNELRPPSSASVRESATTNTRDADATPDRNSTPVDFAPISAIAPRQEPPIKKPARQTSGLVVIVNKANTKTFVRSDISNIYRDRITRWPSGERILVLNLPLDSGERQRFSTEILEMSPLDAATEWSNRTITNRVQNDYRTKNADVVVSYIERHENAIGYVPAATITDNDHVRVVYSIPSGNAD